MDGQKCIVYGLRGPTDERFRYIGQTTSQIEKRLKRHYQRMRKDRRNGKRPYPVHAWLFDLMKKGQVACIEVIDAKGVWDDSEATYVRQYLADGHPLLNDLRMIKGGP